MDLYLVQVCNNHTSYASAYDYWTNGIPGFIKVYTPEAGDIGVSVPHTVNGINFPDGHIFIYVGNGIVFEQNADPDGSVPHEFNRATTYLAGYLRQGEVMNQEQVQSLYIAYWGRQPNQTEINDWVGQGFDKLIAALDNTPQHTQNVNNAIAGANGSTLNKTSVETYIQEHLS